MDKNGNPKAMKHVAADPAPDIAAAGARKTTRPSIATHSQKASLIFSTADPGGGGSRGGVPHAVTNSQAVTAVMHIPPVPINDIIPSGRRRAAVPQLPGVHGVLPGLPDVPHTGYVQTPVADSIGSYGSVSDRTHHFSGVGMSGAHHPAGAASRKHYGDHSNPSVNVQNILTYPDVSAGGYEAPNGVVSPSARAAAAAAAGPSHAGQLKRKPTIHDLFGAPPPVGSLGAGANASPRGGGGGGHKVNASWGAPPVGAAMMNPHHAAAVQATMQHALLRQQMAIAAGAGAGAAGGYGLPQLYGGATPSPHQFAAYQHAIQMQAAAYAFQQQQNVAAAAAAAAASAPNSHRAGGGGGDYKSPRSVSKPKRSESKRPLQIEQHPVWVPPPQAEQEIIAVPKSKITGRGRSRVPAPSAAAPPLAVEYLPPQQQQVVSPRQRRVARAGGQNQVPVQVSPRAAAAVVAAATAANAAAVAAVHPYESRNAYSRPPVAWQPYTVSDYKRLPPVRSDHGLGPDLQNEKLLQKKAQADAVKRVAEDVRRTNRERLSRAAPAPKPVEPEPPIHTSKFARAREFAKKVPLPKSNAGGKPVAAASVAVAADVDDGSGDILDESSAAVAPAGAAASAVMDELNQKHELIVLSGADKGNENWATEIGSAEHKPMVFAALISGFIGNVIQAYVMAYILAISGTAQCCGGLTIATAVFVAFIFTPSFADHIWSMRPFIVAFITLGQHFVGLLLVSSILVYMKAFTAVSAVAGNVSAIGWSGILIATAIRFFVTGFWFSPKAFGDSWLAALIAEKRNPKWFHAAAKAVMPVAFASAILLPLFQTLVIAVLIQYSQVTTAVGAIKLVALLFTGFVAPYSLSDHMWANRPVVLCVVTLSSHFLGLIISALVLSY